MNSPRIPAEIHAAAALLLASCLAAPALADWRTDSGYWQLSAELGGELPTGAGIVVLQTEAFAGIPQAPTSSPTFPGTGNYSAKVFTMDSSGMAESAHANSVATNFYGNSTSASPGVIDVHLMDANDFLGSLGTTSVPPIAAGIIHNHSWKGSTFGSDAADNKRLRAFDFQIDRDGLVSCTPLDNGAGALPVFMANGYHSLSVGVRSGNHSLGGSTADGTGRMKPDLVVNETVTSYAGPAVASVAAMLREAIQSGHTTADHPQAIKAILLAGASKDNLPGWRRLSTTAPYDSTFGAGELNVLNAHHILVKGRQVASTTAEVAASGWDYNTAQSASVKRYYFSVPAGSYGNLFSAALTWHRTLIHSFNFYSSSLPNLDLKLYASSGLVSAATLDQSHSAVDNVEHLFQRNLPAGQYAIEVSSDTDNINYGLAWQVQPGAGPTVALRVEAGVVYLDLANLDPFTTYTIQKSTLPGSGWTDAVPVRTADSTPATTFTWQDPAAPLPAAAFYRLLWTALR